MLLRSRSHSTPKESVLYKSTEDTRACVVKGNRERIFQRGMFTTEKDCEAKIDWVHYVPQTEKKKFGRKDLSGSGSICMWLSMFFMKVQNYGYIATQEFEKER